MHIVLLTSVCVQCTSEVVFDIWLIKRMLFKANFVGQIDFFLTVASCIRFKDQLVSFKKKIPQLFALDPFFTPGQCFKSQFFYCTSFDLDPSVDQR